MFNLIKSFTIELSIKTYNNPKGLCAIGTNNDAVVLVTLSDDKGSLRVYNDKIKKDIKAFEIAVQHIALSLNVMYNLSIGEINISY